MCPKKALASVVEPVFAGIFVMKRAHEDAFIDEIDTYMKDNQLESNLMTDIAASGGFKNHNWTVVRYLIELKMKQVLH